MSRTAPNARCLTRRGFLAGTAGTAGAAVLVSHARANTPAILRAAPAMAQITPAGGPKTPVFAYDGTVPGPTLMVPKGGRLTRTFRNGLDQPSTIHWYGIRIDNAMDGVADLTQPAVPPGDSFAYDFTAPDAGTYWYHPHNRTWEQMARGLYGALIVQEPNPPEVDADATILVEGKVDDLRSTLTINGINVQYDAQGNYSVRVPADPSDPGKITIIATDEFGNQTKEIRNLK